MSAPEGQDFRAAMGLFATGVTVVSFREGGEPAGMTVNSFTSVSLDPPLVLFCPSLQCRFAADVAPGRRFAVSILGEPQKDVCLHFAGVPSLADAPWTEVDDGVPVVRDCLGWLQCTIQESLRQGDHYVVIARVEEVGTSDKQEEPLLFFQGRYPRLAEQSRPNQVPRNG